MVPKGPPMRPMALSDGPATALDPEAPPRRLRAPARERRCTPGIPVPPYPGMLAMPTDTIFGVD
eukprot:6616767-Pyramimonas_sp.AAC.1